MLKEIIELFELIFTLPVAYFMDFCDNMQRRADARISEEEKERRRIAEEKRKAEEARKREEEKEELRQRMLIFEPHIPYSHYQQKKRW